MKNLKKLKRLLQIIFWVSAAGLLVNCEEVDTPTPIAPTDPTPNPEEPILESKIPTLVLKINRQDNASSRQTGIKEAIITIRQDNGTDKPLPTEYEMKKIQIEQSRWLKPHHLRLHH